MRVHVVILAWSFCALAVPAWAEPTKIYSLKSLMERALERSPEIQALELESDAEKAKALQAGRWDDPTLEVGAAWKKEPVGKTNFGRLALSQNISRPGRLRAREEVALDLFKISQLEKSKAQIALQGQVLELIYVYQVAKQKSNHAKERVERFKVVESYLKSRPFAAPQRRAEAGIVRSKLMLAQKELRELQSDEHIAWNNLNLYLGFEDEIQTQASWYKTAPHFRLEELNQKLEAQNPELKQEKVRVHAREKEVSLARLDAWPGFALSAEYSQGSGVSPETNYGLGLSLPLPVWNGNRSYIQASEAAQRAARLRAAWARERISSGLKSSWQHYLAAADLMKELSPEKIDVQEHEMKEVDASFKRGQVDLITYLEADNQHTESLNAILEAQVDFLSSLRELLLLVGEAPQPLEM